MLLPLENDIKMQKDHFEQQTAFTVPACWSEYTTTMAFLSVIPALASKIGLMGIVHMFHLILDLFISHQNDDTFYFPSCLLCISPSYFATP